MLEIYEMFSRRKKKQDEDQVRRIFYAVLKQLCEELPQVRCGPQPNDRTLCTQNKESYHKQTHTSSCALVLGWHLFSYMGYTALL